MEHRPAGVVAAEPEQRQPAAEVLRIAAALEGWEFDRILGAWWNRLVPEDGSEVVRRSAARYAARVTSLA